MATLEDIAERIRRAKDEIDAAVAERATIRRAEREARYAEERRLENECRAALEEECGTAGCAVADELWSIARERAYGLDETGMYYRDLAERLVVPLLAAITKATTE